MTKVKICGLSAPDEVVSAVEAGSDYIGFVFAASRRQVSLQQAQNLARLIPEKVKKVGVFVNPSYEMLEEYIKAVPLDMVQIHGDFEEISSKTLSVPVIRALQVKDELTVPAGQSDYLLLDAPVAGSGQTFDWTKLQNKTFSSPFFIAGGLTADNVGQAIRLFHPFAVDVSSGVESNGRKDAEKIRLFVERVKA
ncbi:phosphoribosylanthranilate isomerase [Streptococcus sp. H49]|uniref:phosphoribosylanthranilate isomerase n=1 Tax=Streptococcus huangxiaojuni TaxID=3237239 RepID=UPI0034A22E4A